MTPSELLDAAKDHFIVLYHDDPEKLVKLVRQALGKYQDKAGVLKSVKTPSEPDADGDIVFDVSLPGDILEVATVRDWGGQFHNWNVDSGVLSVVGQCGSAAPFTVDYWVDMRGFDIAQDQSDWSSATVAYEAGVDAVKTSSGAKFFCVQTHTTDTADVEPTAGTYDDSLWRPYNEVPKESIGILIDYLVALINVPNTFRERNVALATNRQAELPTDEELRARLKDIEEQMEDSQAIIQAVSIRGH